MKKINEIYTVKFRELLPKNFPAGRFNYLSERVLARPDAHQPLICDEVDYSNYKQSVLYEYRLQMYPIFPDSLDTLNWIAVTHRKETLMLNQLGKFKQIVLQEKVSFDSFSKDCTLIREIADQIKLMEKHLKVDQQSRTPTQTTKPSAQKGQTAILRLNKSISRQLDFARRHLQSNEKLFQVKWKHFIEYEPEKTLCPY